MINSIGPDSAGRSKFTVEGYVIPELYGVWVGGENPHWELVLDGRFSIEASNDEMDRWGWLLANAMAISAGYSSFGKNCIPTNKYKVQAMVIEEIEP